MFSKRITTQIFSAAAITLIVIGGAQAKDFYKMSTISLPTPFALNATFAKIVMKYNKGVEVQVNATGAAPRHALDAANGKTDFFFGAPSLMFLMSKGKAMFKKVKNAPELAKNIRSIFNYRMGTYNFAVYESSGIKTLHEIKGKRVFIGPPVGVQKVVASQFIEAVTGLKMNKDYTAVKLGFSAAWQAFQDKQLDMYNNASNHPDANFSQLTLTNKLRFLGASDADWNTPEMKATMKIPGRTRGQFSPNVYGDNQANTKPTQTVSAWVGLYTRKGIPEDVIYKMTKSFWEHIDEMHSVAKWAKTAINKDNIFKAANHKLHPGALKYYKEIGLKIPAKVM
jgi:uncharacterized protein